MTLQELLNKLVGTDQEGLITQINAAVDTIKAKAIKNLETQVSTLKAKVKQHEDGKFSDTVDGFLKEILGDNELSRKQLKALSAKELDELQEKGITDPKELKKELSTIIKTSAKEFGISISKVEDGDGGDGDGNEGEENLFEDGADGKLEARKTQLKETTSFEADEDTGLQA